MYNDHTEMSLYVVSRSVAACITVAATESMGFARTKATRLFCSLPATWRRPDCRDREISKNFEGSAPKKRAQNSPFRM